MEEFTIKAIDDHKTDSEKDFNSCLRAARSTVERAFVRLKERFRAKLEYETTTCYLVVGTCAILHNVCEMRNQNVYERDDETEQVVPFDADMTISHASALRAEDKRNVLVGLFK